MIDKSISLGIEDGKVLNFVDQVTLVGDDTSGLLKEQDLTMAMDS